MSRLNEGMNPSAVQSVLKAAAGPDNDAKYKELLTAWQKDGSKTDVQYVKQFLNNYGITPEQVDEIFNDVFNSEDDSDGEAGSNKTHVILKIAAFAKKNGHTEELINYMKEMYGDELGLNKPEGFASRAKNFAKNIFKEDMKLGRNRKPLLVREATVDDVLRIDQYVKIMSHINPETHSEIGSARTKGRIMESWQKGNRSKKHYGDLLGRIDINIDDLINK